MQARLRILIVDDLSMIVTVLKRVLVKAGHDQIQEAQDGKSALSLLNKAVELGEPYDLVFVDWHMPEMTGIELLEQCKASETLKNIPIVLITAEREKHNILRAMKIGAVDYILKPISEAALAEKIAAILNRLPATQKG